MVPPPSEEVAATPMSATPSSSRSACQPERLTGYGHILLEPTEDPLQPTSRSPQEPRAPPEPERHRPSLRPGMRGRADARCQHDGWNPLWRGTSAAWQTAEVVSAGPGMPPRWWFDALEPVRAHAFPVGSGYSAAGPEREPRENVVRWVIEDGNLPPSAPGHGTNSRRSRSRHRDRMESAGHGFRSGPEIVHRAEHLGAMSRSRRSMQAMRWSSRATHPECVDRRRCAYSDGFVR